MEERKKEEGRRRKNLWVHTVYEAVSPYILLSNNLMRQVLLLSLYFIHEETNLSNFLKSQSWEMVDPGLQSRHQGQNYNINDPFPFPHTN